MIENLRKVRYIGWRISRAVEERVKRTVATVSAKLLGANMIRTLLTSGCDM